MTAGTALEELPPRELATVVPFLARVFLEALDLPVAEILSLELPAAAAAYLPGTDLFLSAREEGRTAGALVLTHAGPAEAPTPLVSWLAVDPRSGRRGLGRQLLSRAVEACRERGAPALEARTPASSAAGPRLLWRLGFRAADIVPFEVAGRTREMLLFRLTLGSAPGRA